jgi:hypothetical protein
LENLKHPPQKKRSCKIQKIPPHPPKKKKKKKENEKGNKKTGRTWHAVGSSSPPVSNSVTDLSSACHVYVKYAKHKLNVPKMGEAARARRRTASKKKEREPHLAEAYKKAVEMGLPQRSLAERPLRRGHLEVDFTSKQGVLVHQLNVLLDAGRPASHLS